MNVCKVAERRSLIPSKGMGEGSLRKSYLTSQINRQRDFIASAPKIAEEEGKKKKRHVDCIATT